MPKRKVIALQDKKPEAESEPIYLKLVNQGDRVQLRVTDVGGAFVYGGTLISFSIDANGELVGRLVGCMSKSLNVKLDDKGRAFISNYSTK